MRDGFGLGAMMKASEGGVWTLVALSGFVMV